MGAGFDDFSHGEPAAARRAMSPEPTAPTPDAGSVLDRASSDAGATLAASDRDALVADAQRRLPDDAATGEVYRSVYEALTARTGDEPAFDRLAAVVRRWQHYHEVTGAVPTGSDPDSAYRETFVANLERAVEANLLNERLTDRYDLDDLAASLEPDRDDRLDGESLDLLRRRFFVETDPGGRPLELPQAFWMRVAMGLALDADDPQRRAKREYDALSEPTLPSVALLLKDSNLEDTLPEPRG